MPISFESDFLPLCGKGVLRKKSFGAKSFLRQKASKMTSLQKKFLSEHLFCTTQNSEYQSLWGFYEISEVTRN
jgi:hypothetical protein